MKRFVIALGLLLPIGFVSSCCSTCKTETAEMVLCEKCGLEKGSPGCCDPAAERCPDCGKIEGSPGCCKPE